MFGTDWNKRLIEAIAQSQQKEIDKCLKKGADKSASLVLAARNNQLNAVYMLMDMGATVNTQDSDSKTALYWAAYHGNVEMAEFLLNSGAEVDCRTTSNFTPLIVAAQRGHAQMIDVLLTAGADIDARTNIGDSALIWAVFKSRAECVKRLLKAGANLDFRDPNNKTALDYAYSRATDEIIKDVQAAHDKRNKPEIKSETGPHSFVNDYTVSKYLGNIEGVGSLAKIFNFEAATVTEVVNGTPGTPLHFGEFSPERSGEITEAYNWALAQGKKPPAPKLLKTASSVPVPLKAMKSD